MAKPRLSTSRLNEGDQHLRAAGGFARRFLDRAGSPRKRGGARSEVEQRLEKPDIASLHRSEPCCHRGLDTVAATDWGSSANRRGRGVKASAPQLFNHLPSSQLHMLTSVGRNNTSRRLTARAGLCLLLPIQHPPVSTFVRTTGSSPAPLTPRQGRLLGRTYRLYCTRRRNAIARMAEMRGKPEPRPERARFRGGLQSRQRGAIQRAKLPGNLPCAGSPDCDLLVRAATTAVLHAACTSESDAMQQLDQGALDCPRSPANLPALPFFSSRGKRSASAWIRSRVLPGGFVPPARDSGFRLREDNMALKRG
jgi:hypothetical protein